MANRAAILFLLVVLFAVVLSHNGVYAFGAGNIPSFAFMEGKAFRHGDIEDTLCQLMKRGAGGALASMFSKGSKWGGLDIKRVYFGNWLRDYSQAVDIAGLKKVQIQTILNLCMALGFLAHGYATAEFEVTEERLGVYLPVEHIDNPKGYGEGEDARRYHPKLRGPVDPRELDIDMDTGMKNYIANERGQWDTSKALVRRTLEQCIHVGRLHRSQNRKQDEYEAYRLLGTALHTLEDFAAHSNFCELTLVSMGYHDVFVHVGDRVRIPVRGNHQKMVAPLVTGTFGSSDFIHSLLGEATDHISSASVSDLNKAIDEARSPGTRGGPAADPADTLRDLLFNLPVGGGDMAREMESVQRIRAGPSQGGKRPEDMSPQELHSVLWQVLTFRDSIVKKIEKTIENIPGLSALIQKLMDSISVFVLTTLEPFLKPILKTATSGLSSASSEVIDNHDQYEVFNDPLASDPTHSFLSKDHFNLILNEPAGNISKIVLTHTVNLVVKAWDDNSANVRAITEDILQCLFHPDFHDPNSKVQREMLQYMRTWVQGLGNKQHDILRRLCKNAVRNHENIRLGGEGGPPPAQGSYAHNQGVQMQTNIQGYVQQIPGVAMISNMTGSGRDMPAGPIPASTLPTFPGGPMGPSGGPHMHNAPGYAPPHGHNAPAHANTYSTPPPITTGQGSTYFTGPQTSYASPTTTSPPPAFPGGLQQGPQYGMAAAPLFPGGAGPTAPEQPVYTPPYNSAPPSFGIPAGPSPGFPDQQSPGYNAYGGAPGGFPSPPGPQGGYNAPPGPPSGYGSPPAGYTSPMAPTSGGYGPPQGPPSSGYNSPPGFPGANQYGSPPGQFPSGPPSNYPSGTYNNYGGSNQPGGW